MLINGIMSTSKPICCEHCGKDNFRSERGLKQHLLYHQICSKKEREKYDGGGKNHEKSKAIIGDLDARRAAVGKEIASMLDEDELAWEKQNAAQDMDMQETEVEDQQDDQNGDALDGESEDSDDGIGLFTYNDLSDDSNDDDDDEMEVDDDDDASDSSIADPLNNARFSFAQYCRTAEAKFGPLEDHVITGTKLLTLLRNKKAPLDTYDAVMDWHLRDKGVLQDHESLCHAGKEYIGREALMESLKKRYNMEHKFTKTTSIILPKSKAKVNIERHDPEDMVHDIMTDPLWKDDDFVYFNDDPLAPPPYNLDYIGDLHTGEAYIQAHRNLIQPGERAQLFGITLYIDGAVTDMYGKLQVEALQFTLSCLSRKARDQKHAWRPLGYVPTYSEEISKGKRMFLQSGHMASVMLEQEVCPGEGDDDDVDPSDADKAIDLHAILGCMLEPMKPLFERGMMMDIQYKGQIYKDVHAKFVIIGIKADNDEAAKLVANYQSRSTTVKKLCQSCLHPTKYFDKVLLKYPYRTEAMIKRLLEKNKLDRLKAMSIHPVWNAFWDLPFACDRGIYSALPVDVLHTVLLGLFKYVRDCFFEQIGESSANANEVNALAKLYGTFFQRQSDRNMPKCHFRNGIQGGKLMAKEYTGVMLVIAVILRCDIGRGILQSSRKGNFKEEWLIRDWTLLVETVLQWEQFLKLDTMDKKVVKKLDKKHRYIMFLMKKVWPCLQLLALPMCFDTHPVQSHHHRLKKIGNRCKGAGMKVMKFHAITHMAKDILMYGVPMVWDTGSNESHHKSTKTSAKLTSRNSKEFDRQTAIREDEALVLDLLKQELEGRPLWDYYDGYIHGPPDEEQQLDDDDDGNDNNTSTAGTVLVVFRDEDGESNWNFARKRSPNQAISSSSWDTPVIDFLVGLQDQVLQYMHELPIRCEHTRFGQIFRGHPNYRGKGYWNDWAIVDWGPGWGRLPCEIWCFIDLTTLPDGVTVKHFGQRLDANVYALVESCSYSQDEKDNLQSDIFLPIKKYLEVDANGQPQTRSLYLADVDAIVEPVVVVPNIGCEDKRSYFQVRSRAKWSEDFLRWVQEPHTLDEIDEEEGVIDEEEDAQG